MNCELVAPPHPLTATMYCTNASLPQAMSVTGGQHNWNFKVYIKVDKFDVNNSVNWWYQGGVQQVELLEPLVRKSTSQLVELVWYWAFEEYIYIHVIQRSKPILNQNLTTLDHSEGSCPRFRQMAEPEPWSCSRFMKYWAKTRQNQTMAALIRANMLVGHCWKSVKSCTCRNQYKMHGNSA